MLGKTILEKISDIRTKALELGSLIEKMKSYDIGEDILLKWETENNRLLDRLKEDEKNALDVNVPIDEGRELPPKGGAKKNQLFD